MSQYLEVEMQCPRCKAKGKAKLWPALNSKEDPNETELLLKNRLFDFECPKCNALTRTAYMMDYSDVENNVVIHMVTPQDVPELDRKLHMIENNVASFSIGASSVELTEFSDMLSKKRHRIVVDQNALIEKAIIFNAGLDDRVVEMVKMIYGNNLVETHPELKFDDILFLIDNGNRMLQIMYQGNGVGQIEMQNDVYTALEEDFKEILKNDGTYIVDHNWARNVLSNP